MITPWFLLSLLFTLARSFSVSRHPADETGYLESPTCDELRDFWKILSQQAIRGMGPETNEIPVMPPKMTPALDYILTKPSRQGKHRNFFRKYGKELFPSHLMSTDPFSNNPSIMQTLVPPNSMPLPKSKMTSDSEGNGIFGEFHDPFAERSILSNHRQTDPEVSEFGPSSSVPLEDKKNGEREYYIPQWGSPDEVDTFGNFIDFDIGSPHFAISRTPKDALNEWLDPPREIINRKLSEVTCDVIMNSDCTGDEQCLCKGWKNLQCIQGKCSSYYQHGYLEGIWHEEPIPYWQLQHLAKPRKRSLRSIFM